MEPPVGRAPEAARASDTALEVGMLVLSEPRVVTTEVMPLNRVTNRLYAVARAVVKEAVTASRMVLLLWVCALVTAPFRFASVWV